MPIKRGGERVLMSTEDKTKAGSMLRDVALWLNVVMMVSTLALVVWRGGVLAATVETDRARIEKLENNGSRGLIRHEGLDDQRIGDLNNRVKRLEDAVLSFAAIQSDVAEVKTAVEFLTGKRRTTMMP